MLFYEIKVNYQRQTGEDNPGKVKETYLVEGLNCSDVEGRLIEDIKPFVFGELEVPSCKKVQVFDLINDPEGDRWFKARVELITVEESGKETRKTITILVQANTIQQALKNVQTHMSGNDCEIVSIMRSPILEVYRAIN
ncbi:MAG: DUF4494 domain-containing protein [Paludibacteraceae bacterium]|nr:DUF4494 domain-containing protein [Paludibacteraceae bacterium]